MSTFAEQRRARLAEILGDKSSPRENRIERVARFVEEEVRRAFSRGVRQARQPKVPASRLVRDDATVVEEDDL